VARDTIITTEPYVGPQVVARDRTHWGPVWAGLLTAFASYMVVELFLYWAGALVVHAGPGGRFIGGPNNAWISAIMGVCTFFLGGYIASRSSLIRSRGSGAFNGLLVWSLGMVLILVASAAGAGMAMGAASDAFTRFMVHGATGMSNGPFAGIDRDAAGWGCLFLVVSAIGAAAGGMFGETAIVRRGQFTR